MKRYINSILILSVAGIALSGILLYQHYNPEMNMGVISCGKGFHNPCIAVGQSKYADFLGIPVAAFGLTFYIFVTFMLLLADYTKEKYYTAINGILFPIVTMGIAADIVLAVLMVKVGSLCSLCVATYAINIAMLILFIIMIKKHSSPAETADSVKNLLKPVTPDQKAVLALFILFMFFMVFSVASGTALMKARSGQKVPSEQVIAKELAAFYAGPVTSLEFPESKMVIGSKNPRLKIYVFNDFLCSYCYKFYQVEKYILAKYGDRVQIVYYHYPLDRTCNRYFDDTLYRGSCMSSKSMYAASVAGFFEEYFYMHFSSYKEIKENFDESRVRKLVSMTEAKFGIDSGKIAKFNEVFNSPVYPDAVTADTEFAEKLKISGTPTIYISGRELNGAPVKELIEAIINSELSKSGR